jgi:TRAP-type mannitol/chloroaromatic compound transport system permease small subunit
MASMNMLDIVAKAITWLNTMVGRLTAYLILLMFALLFAEVLFRYLWRTPSVWTGELSQMLFAAYALLGGGYLLARNGHVNVDIFYANFPHRTKAAVDIVTSILFFLFIGTLVWQGLSLAADSVARWERSHSAWNPPVWPIKAIIPISAALVLLQGIVKLASDILVVLGRRPLAAANDRGSAEDAL